MTKRSVTVDSGPTVDSRLNTFIPGPDYEATAKDDKGHEVTGHGNTRAEAEQDALDKLPKR